MLRQLLSPTLRRTIAPLVARSYAASSADGGASQPPQKQDLNNASVPIVDYDDPDYLPLPEYPLRPDEPLEKRKARLVYQSRKRGMLENDLLLSTFASKYLKELSPELTAQYDQLINGVTNDWDIYYWATDVKPTPPEHDNEIMRLLKKHVANEDREQRFVQPNL